MKRKICVLSLILSLLFLQGNVFADGASIEFDAENSVVRVKFDSSNYENYKVQVSKGSTKYNYNLYDGDEVFPLQMGSGSYTVKLYERVSGNKYRSISSKTNYLKLEENKVFLQSVQNINWSDKSKAISLAKELGLEKATTKEQFQSIYDEIVKSIVYDYQKASSVSTRYLPTIDSVYVEKKGICYDYSALMASMLRSLNIPTKMIHGYSVNTGEVYHAWNEVLLNEKWIVVDTTIDAQLFRMGNPYQGEKSTGDYKAEKEF